MYTQQQEDDHSSSRFTIDCPVEGHWLTSEKSMWFITHGVSLKAALPKTSSHHLKRKRSYSNHPFSGVNMLVSGRVCFCVTFFQASKFTARFFQRRRAPKTGSGTAWFHPHESRQKHILLSLKQQKWGKNRGRKLEVGFFIPNTLQIGLFQAYIFHVGSILRAFCCYFQGVYIPKNPETCLE